MKGCKNLESLSDYISLESLEIFDLSGCSRLKKFPKIVGNMSHLFELNLENTGIKDLSLEHLTGLITLHLGHCKNLSSLSEASCSLPSLKILCLHGCSKLDKLPENLGNLEGLVWLIVGRTAIKGLPPSIVRLKNLKRLLLEECSGLSPKQSNLLLSTLSALPSFTDLNLSYCNIRAIPDVFGCFPSLRLLNLSGNNFVCLPESIILLSNLKLLDLSYCTDLQLLPELPLNIRSIRVDGCISLETLPIRPEDDFHPSLSLLKCVKLIKNQGYGSDIFLTMLRRYFQVSFSLITPDPRDIDVFIPGSEIPKWFRHQSVGGSMEFLEEGPSDFMGIAVCAVFVCRQHHPFHQSPSKISRFHLTWFYNVIGCTGDNRGLDFAGESIEIDSYNLCLKYFPFWKKGKLSLIHTNGLSRIIVRCEAECPGLEITKCGARLVDKKAIEDLKQSMTGCSLIPYDGDELGTTLSLSCGEASSSNDVDVPHLNLNETACEEEESSETASCHESPLLINFFKTEGPGLEVTKCGAHLVYNGRCVISPYEDDLDDSAKDTKIQQNRDDYVGDELAGFSGEAGTSKSNDVDVPHPKRILFPNLIERLMLCFGNWIGSLCTQGQGDSDCEEEE